MRIQLDPEWLIDCDTDSCQLIRLRMITGENNRGKQAKAENIGKMREENNGFYARLDQALAAYLIKSTHELKDTKTAQELIDHINRAVATIAAAVAHLPVRGLAKV